MILAAGLGTRLRPLTDSIPKALVNVGNKTMLEHVAQRLVDAGADRLIINVHHHADAVIHFLGETDLGARVEISVEDEQRLETGGGVKHARQHFRRDAPFFLHNADVMSSIDLRALYQDHLASGAFATLAVRPVETARYLIFDRAGLCGYGAADKHATSGSDNLIRDVDGPVTRYDFCGIHVIEPRIFDAFTEDGAFSIINTYLRLAREGEVIRPFVSTAPWIDIGTHERLEEAQRMFGR